MSRTIPATWQNFEAFSSQTSTLLHAVSEFVDNSISSYLRVNNNDIKGLNIYIGISNQYYENNKIIQCLKVCDNAGGMSEEELYQAIIPNNTNNKKDTRLNQYGVGMKLASFWLGQQLTIKTRNKKNNQFNLDIDIMKHNLQDIATVEITHGIDEQDEQTKWFTYGKYDTGTVITVNKIRDKPNRIIKESEVEELAKGLGWRYFSLLKPKEFEIEINFHSDRGYVRKVVNPFKINPFILRDSANALHSDRKYKFDIDEYREKIICASKDAYKTHKIEIDKITGSKNFIEELENDRPLIFEYETEVESKKVIVKWGVIAEEKTKLNYPFKLKELEGITLLHGGRAIMHGPNYFNKTNDKGETRIGTYSFLKDEGSGGENRYRWLFGTIDLTDVEEPERNKTTFLWGRSGKNDLDNIVKNIRSSMIDILNEIGNIPNKIKKPIYRGSEKTNDKVMQCINSTLGEHFEIKPYDSSGNRWYGKIHNIKFNNQSSFDFEIENVSDDINKPFDAVFDNKAGITKISLNIDFYLWKDFIYRNDDVGIRFKGLIYPLVVALAICQVIFDNNMEDGLKPKFPKKIKEISNTPFDEVLSTVLDFFKSNKEN